MGKTDLLMELFSEEGEVISADSMQVYRGLCIGTAKPDRAAMERLTHHLIDIRDPDEQFNAGEFVDEANRLVVAVEMRHRTPIVSGGTPFYFRNFIYGLPETPPGDGAVRAEVRSEIERIGLKAAHELLEKLDPVAARRIQEADRYRIERALEVIRATGRKFSSFAVSPTVRDDLDMLLIGLDRPREELYRRINRRVELMFEAGLPDEVASLISAGYGRHSPGMQGIGYREFLEMCETGCSTMSDVKDVIAGNSRRYAKRQLTFFKRFPGTRWFHPDQREAIREAVRSFLT